MTHRITCYLQRAAERRSRVRDGAGAALSNCLLCLSLSQSAKLVSTKDASHADSSGESESLLLYTCQNGKTNPLTCFIISFQRAVLVFFQKACCHPALVRLRKCQRSENNTVIKSTAVKPDGLGAASASPDDLQTLPQ